MTNNEAIEIIIHFDKYITPCDEYGYRIKGELVEAHQMAVCALVKQKHGRWISHNKGQNNWVECSECNTVGSPFWKRCPICEAKMDGGAEDAQRGKEVPAQN